MTIRLNIAKIFFITTILFSTGTHAAEFPNTLCAFGYINKLSAHMNSANSEHHYVFNVDFDTTGFISPRKQIAVFMLQSAVDASRYQGVLSTDTTELLRNAFTSHRPVRVFTTPNKLGPTLCYGGPTEFNFEICSNKECST